MIRIENSVQHVDQRDDHPQAGLSYADDPAEAEQHALLVLLDDAHRQPQDKHSDREQDDDDSDQNVHECLEGRSLCSPALSVLAPGRRRVRRSRSRLAEIRHCTVRLAAQKCQACALTHRRCVRGGVR